jgi:hypothetical protein
LDTLFDQSLTGLRLDGIGGYAVGRGTLMIFDQAAS